MPVGCGCSRPIHPSCGYGGAGGIANFHFPGFIPAAAAPVPVIPYAPVAIEHFHGPGLPDIAPPPGTLGRTYHRPTREIPEEKHPRVAMLEVAAPLDTRVTVDGMEGFFGTDNRWHFETKPLIPGLPNIYTVVAASPAPTGEPVKSAKKVRLIPGRIVELDFTDAASLSGQTIPSVPPAEAYPPGYDAAPQEYPLYQPGDDTAVPSYPPQAGQPPVYSSPNVQPRQPYRPGAPANGDYRTPGGTPFAPGAPPPPPQDPGLQPPQTTLPPVLQPQLPQVPPID